jgi:DNA-binding transcriptional ArsR family regulator
MGTDFAHVGRLLANPARSAMLDALMEGRPLAAGELARVARVSPSTASEYLGDLIKGGLALMERQGRHRYYRLAGPDIAAALEGLARICPPTPVRSLRASSEARAIAFARTCYDHLAGWLGVAVLDTLLERDWLTAAPAGYVLTASGQLAMAAAGVDVAGAMARRRAFARPCLDWTERRPHLAGALGAAVTALVLERGWVERDGVGRGLRVTRAGRTGLAQAFGLDAGVLAGGLARPA